MTLRFFIRHTATGEEREDTTSSPEGRAWSEVEFWWTDGNGGCDCNREMFFDVAGGADPDWDRYRCTDGRFTLRVEENGVTVYDERGGG